jgi:hypothetical protein
MQLPEGTHLAYTVAHETWYWANSSLPTDPLHVRVEARYGDENRGVAWSFPIEELSYGLRLGITDENWGALRDIPEFFTLLAELDVSVATLDQVRVLLDGLGAVDATVRARPSTSLPNDILTDEGRLLAIDARVDKAAKGPWRLQNLDTDQDVNPLVVSDDGMMEIDFGYRGNRPHDNAEFVAHARMDVPWLRELVRQRDAAIKLLESELANHRANELDDGRATGLSGTEGDDHPY